jgi:LmbE family N-acetylglucosaminyl deacetylase
MKRAIILILAMLTLWHLDNSAIKLLIRKFSVWAFRRILARIALPLKITKGPVIIFSPHPDDETLGCGGLIARKRTSGWPVHVVFITDGSASHPLHPRISPDMLRARRHDEALAALRTLGVEKDCIHFLDEKDGMLPRLNPMRREIIISRIARILNEVRPDKIFLPCHKDGSSEHDAAFSLVILGIVRSRCRPTIWQYPIWAWWNPLLLLEHIIFAGWHYRLHSEDYHTLKQQALECYCSQTRPIPPWTKAPIPPELLSIFRKPYEFYFRYDLANDAMRPREIGRDIII